MIHSHRFTLIIVFPYRMPDRQNVTTMNTDGHQPFPAEPPSQQGLYDPRAESDACGVGFVVHQKGKKSHDIVAKALQVAQSAHGFFDSDSQAYRFVLRVAGQPLWNAPKQPENGTDTVSAFVVAESA